MPASAGQPTAPEPRPRPASDSARAQELEALFRAALAAAPDERAELLARRCGDDHELCARVRALLDEDARGTRGILRAQATRPPAEAEERIGRYRLVRILGQGGMGTVHLAEQEEPVQRLVALKTIRLGSFSPEATARFAAECQALAEMDHPGIAKIFDGGLTDGGLPYLVTEYTPGLPLTDHCDRHRLPLDERLECLAKVSDAVQHAHQKGIVHRDLKPGNVLVDVREGQHVPHVIDFGLARALAGPLARGAPQPLTDRLGTPAYMSPSRLAGETGVDTRDDVYALGVMLYELVTARHPFEPGSRVERLRSLASDPPAPSARLAALGADLAEAAALRATTPGRLLRRVRGELDQLVLCALAREASERYPSAAALAEDLRRFLRHETLLGVPTRPALRARKFLRRHWLGATLGTLLVAALVVGLVAQRRAWGAAERGRLAAEVARVEALRQRDLAHGERAEADLLVRAFKEALLLAQAGEGSDEALSVAELLEVLASHVEALGKTSPGAEAALRSALGRAYLVLGVEERALEQYLRAHAIGAGALAEDALDRFEILEGLIESSRRTGDLAGAQGYVRQAILTARDVFAGRDARFLAALETLLGLAAGATTSGEAALGALAVVLATLPDAIVRGDESGVTARILIEAAVQLLQQGPAQAAPFLAALEERARVLLGPEDVRLVTFLWALMQARLQRGVPAGAEAVAAGRELARAAEARLAPGHWLRSDARRMLGQALLAQGSLPEAEDELVSALAEARRSRGWSPRRLLLAREALDELARALAALDARTIEGFLARSYNAHGPLAARDSPWWVSVQAGLPAEVLESAERFLRARPEGEARVALAMLLTRAHRFEEGLQVFAAEPGELPTAARALRVSALAGSGRLGEARAELLDLAQGPVTPDADPELRAWIAELRDLVGL